MKSLLKKKKNLIIFQNNIPFIYLYNFLYLLEQEMLVKAFN